MNSPFPTSHIFKIPPFPGLSNPDPGFGEKAERAVLPPLSDFVLRILRDRVPKEPDKKKSYPLRQTRGRRKATRLANPAISVASAT